MNCIKDTLEIIYYIAFIVLTFKIVQYARRTYELEASQKYELLCDFAIHDISSGQHYIGFALEIYNAGNKVAKNVDVVIDEKKITTINFIKPNASYVFPVGEMLQTMGGNISFGNNNVEIVQGKKIKVLLTVDGESIEYNLSSDLLFATRLAETGSIKDIERALKQIDKDLSLIHHSIGLSRH